MTWTNPWLRRFTAAGIVILLRASIAVLPGARAWAVEYPTWGQVAAARASEAAAQALAVQILGQLASLRGQAEQTAALAEARGDEYEEADQRFQAAAARAGLAGKVSSAGWASPTAGRTVSPYG